MTVLEYLLSLSLSFGGGRIEADAGAHCPSVEMVYRLYIIIDLVLRILRFRFDGSLSGFFHLSGRYARLQCKPLAGFAGGSSRSMDDPADNGSLFLYLHKCTDDNLVAQTFCSEFPQTSEERRGKETAEEGTQEFTTSQPQEVEFNLKRTYKQTPPPAPVMDIQAEEPKEESPVNTPEPDDELPSADEAEGVTMVFEPTVSDVVPPAAQDELPGEDEPGFQVETATSEEEYQGPEQEPYNPMKDLENYRFPTIDLMKHFENDDPTIDMDEQNANKDRIINTLRSFGIEISTIKATVGPTVTLYEITPEQGVRISKIRGLEDDIALSLSADGIRIIAPIPGKGTIGIEVPNKNPKIVSGQSVIGSKKFQESKFDLPIVLGKTITNEVFMFDLCKMPHVLVAGATGQGKSVGLNAIITSLLYKKHPAELKFVLVDPKKVEFSIYSVIENHFLAKLPDGGEPIITDVTKVVQTLNSVCVEMDTRL